MYQINAPWLYRSSLIFLLLFLFSIALLLRLLFLGNTFQSSDNAELAFKILRNPGYLWVIREEYGALINIYVKLFVGSLSSIGVTITEFWWKVPIALLGSLQAAMTYIFLKRRIGCSMIAALSGAALVSILPVHVFESRYLWGYEVLGVFFVTIAIWKFVDFLEQPTQKTGILASIALGLYLISHGYIIPFIPCIILITILFSPFPNENILNRFTKGIILCWRNRIFMIPLLFLPLYLQPVRHSLRKPTQAGFYLQEHGPAFIENTGYFLTSLMLTAALIIICLPIVNRKYAMLLLICAVSYLAPLFFGTPPGITVIRGYMLMRTYFLVLCTAIVLDNFLGKENSRGLLLVVISICFLVTLWGTVESIFGRDKLIDPSGVKIGRGGIPPDPGSKAAGFLIRKYVKDSQEVLAIHRSVEPPNLFYYFERLGHSFFDLSFAASIDKYHQLKDKVDVVICSDDQAPAIESDNSFGRKVLIVSENNPRMLIYAKSHVELPVIISDARELNEAFDRIYSWRVNLR